jgi:hypothetical protein
MKKTALTSLFFLITISFVNGQNKYTDTIEELGNEMSIAFIN